jgi:hypothetical protein
LVFKTIKKSSKIIFKFLIYKNTKYILQKLTPKIKQPIISTNYNPAFPTKKQKTGLNVFDWWQAGS